MKGRGKMYLCPGCCNCAPSNFNDPMCNGDRNPVPAVPCDEESLEIARDEVRGLIRQLKAGTLSIDEIQPSSLVDDIVNALARGRL